MNKEIATTRNWDDIVFSHRNKAYGAFAIRHAYHSSVVVGLGVSMTLALLLVMLPDVFALFGYHPSPKTSIVKDMDCKLRVYSCKLELPPPPARRKKSKDKFETLDQAFPIVRPKQVGTRAPKNETELVCSLPKVSSLELNAQKDLVGSLAPRDITCRLPMVDKWPEFPGGPSALKKFIAKNFRCPKSAAKLDIEGTVFVTFVVNKNGSVGEVQCVRGIYPDFDQEALRVVSLLQDWVPGQQNGRAVAVWMTLPIRVDLVGGD
jgi:periplasmic protein TonB